MPSLAARQPTDYHLYPTPTQAQFLLSEAVINVIVGPMGSGKCLKKGERCLMYDGTLKAVEHIEVGDLLMGDDSTPRTVLSLGRGLDDLYEVVPVKGEPFTVNSQHILSLKRTRRQNTKRGKPFHDRLAGTVVDLPIQEYIASSPTFKMIHHLFRVPVDFPFRPVDIPPYFLGLWLGDGHAHTPAITTSDPEIVEYLHKYAGSIGLMVRETALPQNQSRTYTLHNGFPGKPETILRMLFRDHNLWNNKHIPHRYKCNDRQVRLELLAGLIDSDGYMRRGCCDITQKSKVLAEDICYLARSLGFYASMKECTKRIKSSGFSGQYYRLSISGDFSDVPMKVQRKIALPRRQKKDVLVTGIKEIRHIGTGEYYGFVIDGNHRFLLQDFTVTHNTYACILGILAHAQRGGVPLEVAIIRDTHENIKNSVVVAFNEFFQRYPDLPYKWRSDFHDLTIYANPRIHCRLFGIDDMTGLTRLQGPEYGLVWLEEIAPYTDSHRTNAGISEDTFNAALVRCARQRTVRARLQLSSNPPDEEHWFYKRLLVPPDGPVHPTTPLITKRVFHVPVGENIHLKDEAIQATMAAYMHDEAAYARFVLGQSATRFPGKRVAENFNADWHVAQEALDPIKGLSGWISFDSWGHPAAVLGQQWPDGRVWVLDVCQGASDIRALIQDEIKPRLQLPRWKDMCRDWRYIGDCTMLQPDQSNIEISAAKIIEQSFPDPEGFDAIFEPGPSTWHLIKNGLQQTLRWTTKGHPTLLIDPVHCKPLITAFKGAWHYPVSKTGVMTRNTPVKDEASHLADAAANAFCVLCGWDPPKRRNRRRTQQMNLRGRKRAASYAA